VTFAMPGKSGREGPKFLIPQSKYTIQVYKTDVNKVVEMKIDDYLVGVLSAEMPASFDIEALKAQADAARTYTMLRMKKFGGKGCANHPEADICTDSTHCQAFRDPENIKANLNKYKEAVAATKDEVIVYNDQLIDAVFHSTSGGRTENSEDIWSAKIPYLRSVDSSWDEEVSPVFEEYYHFTLNEFYQALSLSYQAKLSLEVIQATSTGRTKKIKINDKTFAASEVVNALHLRSTFFTIKQDGINILITTKGYGHGVGMSQYGAEGMAKQGYSYDEILKHYYQGISIKKI
jgi:stage II sporulation protein D